MSCGEYECIELLNFGSFYAAVISDNIYAAGNLGTLNIKLSSLNFGRRGAGVLHLYNVRTSIGQRQLQHAGPLVSRRSKEVLSVCSSSSLETLRECFVDASLSLLYLDYSVNIKTINVVISL